MPGSSSEEETAAYLYANRHRQDEIFSGETAQFQTSADVTTVISVRLNGDDLHALQQAATARDLKLSTFIRQAALTVAANSCAQGLATDAQAFQSSLAVAFKHLSSAAALAGAPVAVPVSVSFGQHRQVAGRRRGRSSAKILAG